MLSEVLVINHPAGPVVRLVGFDLICWVMNPEICTRLATFTYHKALDPCTQVGNDSRGP